MKVNEIFYSIQGEGFHAGEAAVFIRFAGCNLSCPFCDTNHHPFKEITEEEICAEVEKYPSRLVVITGGEPTLQLTASLVGKLHRLHREVAIETNGTKEIPNGVDWVTVSPKDDFVANGEPVIKRADEVKIVFNGTNTPTKDICALYYYIQPCDTGDAERNKEILAQCVEFVKNNPLWKLSLQQQKILNVR